MRLARYHCRKPGEPEFIDRKFPGLYNARRDSLGKYWKELFGATHAVMLAESFFENVSATERTTCCISFRSPRARCDRVLVASGGIRKVERPAVVRGDHR